MKEPKPKTAKEEWVEFSGEIQKEVNNILDDIQLEIEAVNDRLAMLHEEDPEAAKQLSKEIVEYLDSMWGYFGDYFMVTGKWYLPENCALTINGFTCSYHKADALDIARSNGFIVYPVTDSGKEVPTVGLSFIVGPGINFSTATMQGKIHLLAFAKTDETSIQFLRPRGSENVGASAEEVSRAAEAADSLLFAYLNHKDSNFYNSSAKKQGEFLRSVIDMASDALPTGTLDKLILKDTRIPDLYIREVTSNRLIHLDAGGEELVINHGVVMDFTTIDTIRDGFGQVQYASPEQVDAYTNGLCLVVKPTDCNFDLEQFNNPDIIVPLRSSLGNMNFYIEYPLD